MVLENTIRQDNLVVVKETSKLFGDKQHKVFKPNHFFRSIFLENENQVEVLVNGEVFVNDDFSENFELAQTKILRDFTELGIIKDGKIISKTAFKKKCDVTTYGNSRHGLKVCFIYNSREVMYGFFPYFRGGTKENIINVAYKNVKDIIDGDMTSVDEDYVQFGNCGRPISASSYTKLRII